MFLMWTGTLFLETKEDKCNTLQSEQMKSCYLKGQIVIKSVIERTIGSKNATRKVFDASVSCVKKSPLSLFRYCLAFIPNFCSGGKVAEMT